MPFAKLSRLCVASALLALLVPVYGQDAYKFTALGNFQPTSINNYGQISGRNFDTKKATLWTPGVRNGTTGAFRDFDFDTTLWTFATHVNELGQVVGYVYDFESSSFDNGRAFLFTPSSPNGTTGTFQYLNDANGGPSFGINNLGQTSFGDGLNGDVFLWTPSTQNGTTGSTAQLPYFTYHVLNDYGQVGGDGYVLDFLFFIRRTFIWTPSTKNGASGEAKSIGSLNPDGETYFGDMNSSGQIVGESDTTVSAGNFFYRHAFLWTPSSPNSNTGTMVDIDPVPDRSSYANHISDNGDILGGYVISVNGEIERHPFLYRNGQFIELRNFAPAGSGIVLNFVYDMNDKGQIIGAGTLNGVGTAFLLSPVKSDAKVVDLRTQVGSLVTMGALLPANGQSLYAKLNSAQAKINSGDIAGAISDLKAFINQVTTFVKTGKLSAAQGKALVDAANAVIQYLSS